MSIIRRSQQGTRGLLPERPLRKGPNSIYTHKKQTGGAGQYGRVAGYMEPVADSDFLFVNEVSGGSIPTQFYRGLRKRFPLVPAQGSQMEFPVTGIRVAINDGASHTVDSSDNAFQAAARGAFREGYAKAKPVIHEPIMKVVVETPTEFQGAAMGLMNQRRGMIIGWQEEGPMSVIEAQIPLAEMFGFSTILRSSTQGKAQFTMEFAIYRLVPQSVAEKISQKKGRSAKKRPLNATALKPALRNTVNHRSYCKTHCRQVPRQMTETCAVHLIDRKDIYDNKELLLRNPLGILGQLEGNDPVPRSTF